MSAESMNSFSSLLRERVVLLADGATGTGLFEMGLATGEAPELWNAERPDAIRALHEGFVSAGSDLFLTNSFGGNRCRLKLHGAENRVGELNRLAAGIARAVADSASREVIVAGSVGPSGELLEPLGSLTRSDAVEVFSEQMEALKHGGVDMLWIETMSCEREISSACEAASSSGLPWAITASFDTAGKTMMGLSPSALPELVGEFDPSPVAVGANCGVGASDTVASILRMTEGGLGIPAIAKANCGVPEFRGGEVEYSGSPGTMGAYAGLAIDAGARIVGGCCGTRCEHIAAMREAIDRRVSESLSGARPSLDEVVSALGPMVNAPPSDLSRGESPARSRRGNRRGGSGASAA